RDGPQPDFPPFVRGGRGGAVDEPPGTSRGSLMPCTGRTFEAESRVVRLSPGVIAPSPLGEGRGEGFVFFYPPSSILDPPGPSLLVSPSPCLLVCSSTPSVCPRRHAPTELTLRA